MVKYLNFHNSSFALKYFKSKWQGQSVCATPLISLAYIMWTENGYGIFVHGEEGYMFFSSICEKKGYETFHPLI
jgi:hypothetical protein